MQNTTESNEILNPAMPCHESRHVEEPEHVVRGGLIDPFFHPKKKVDPATDAVVR